MPFAFFGHIIDSDQVWKKYIGNNYENFDWTRKLQKCQNFKNAK
jgi:hypothetical protein